MPKVSIIIPVYNAANFLEQCLESIFKGNLKDIEVITINDGSTDNSLEILENYQKEFNVKIINQENGGPSRARNRGLEVATGEYIGFVDADDWVEPDMFSKMYLEAKKENADIVFCNVFRNEDKKMKKFLASGIYDKNAIQQYIFPLLISNNDELSGRMTIRGSVCLRIFRKDLIHDLRFNENLIYNEDGLFCIAATIKCNKYIYLGDCYLYHNRYVSNSLTKRYISNLWDIQRKLIQQLDSLVSNCIYDFSSQINKKALDIAIYCIENSCKKERLKNSKETISEITKIILSKEAQIAIKKVPFKRLKKINKLYWLSIAIKSPLLARFAARYRMKKNGLL